MKKYYKVTVVIYILILSNLIILQNNSTSLDNSLVLDSIVPDIEIDEFENQFLTDTYQTRGSLHSNDWIDTFEEVSGIESHANLNVTSGQARLELDTANVVFTDDFSNAQLDTSKWNGQINGGTQIVPSPMLMAIKIDQAQTQDSYIETDDTWSIERIVEWDWISIVEGGYGGYDHIIYPYFSIQNNIWVKIQGDKRVILGSSSGVTSDPTYTIKENHWYQMKCKISSTEAIFTIYNETGALLNIQTISHQITGYGNLRITFANKSSNIASFDVRVDNIDIKSGYLTSASLTSIEINLPLDKNWDTFALTKSEPEFTKIKVTLLNAENDQPIPGYEDIEDIYYDISLIDPVAYPSLKLYAALTSMSITSTPVLFQWGISWIGTNTWQDTFIGESKLQTFTNLNVENGEIILDEGQLEGSIISNPIYLPNEYFWNSIVIEKTESLSTSITITVLDHYTDQALEIIGIQATVISILTINPLSHPVIKLKANFVGTEFETPILYRWNLNWSKNTLPEISSFQAPASVLRTNTVQMSTKCTDIENSEKDLILEFTYKSSIDVNWQSEYFSNLKYYNNFWIIDFTPQAGAQIGNYSVKLTCLDKFGGSNVETFSNAVKVLNNPPAQPKLTITPIDPTSAENLVCLVENLTDIENNFVNVRFEWYKDNILQSELISDSVPASYTSRNEVWKCVVTPNDGFNDGQPDEIEIYIKNTPPEGINPPNRIYIDEDVIDSSTINLSELFVDRDGDKLKFFISGDVNVSVNILPENGLVIFNPDKDWVGDQNIIFQINDSKAEIEYSLIVTVLPVNDAPVIEKVNNILVTTRDELTVIGEIGQDLTFNIKSYDIDSEVLDYSIKLDNGSSRSPRNLKIDEVSGQIRFKPTSDDVGVVSINVTVTDNKGGSDWKVINIKVLEEKKPWYEFDFQTLLIMGAVILLIVLIISGFLFIEWRNIKKRKEAEQEKAQKSEEKYEPEQKHVSTLELLEILDWRFSRKEIDSKTYKELKKSILEMKGNSVQVNSISSTLYEEPPEETPPPPEPALTPPPLIIQEPSRQLVQRFDLPSLPPAQEPEKDED
jgi:hypothetical protein